jgi:hypothetical protein
MTVMARLGSGRASTPAPVGLHRAVCVDVQDLGVQDSAWGAKHKVRLVWQIELLDPAGRRFELARKYTLSLHERAALRQSLESWRGKKFTDSELRAGFDLEKLIGVNCQLQATHDTGEDGVTYANVQTVLPPVKGMTRLVPDAFVRLKDRTPMGTGARRA